MRHRQASPPRSRTLTTTKGETAVLFVGWDWASTSHAVTILDTSGMIMDRWTLGHTESDLDTILARLAAHGDPADLPVAIERSDGLVVARLLAAGHPVVPINPGAFHAARPRWSAAGAKTAASNQLGALLDAHWPGAKQVFFRPASKIALAFLAEYPTPQAAARLYQAHLTAFCRRHAYRGGQISLGQLLAEVGPILDRTTSAEHAAGEVGATPVTRASGKTSSVHFRLAANRRARQALHIFADNSAAAPHGRPPSTPTRAPAANATPKPSASWAERGYGSSGRAGTPTRPTTPPSIAPNNASPPDDLTQETQALRRTGGVQTPRAHDQPGVEILRPT